MRRTPRITDLMFTLVGATAFSGAIASADDPPASGPAPTVLTPAASEIVNLAMGAMGGALLFDGVNSVAYDCTMANDQGTMLMKVQSKENVGVTLEQSLTPPGGDAPIRRQMLTTNADGGWARDLDEGGLQLMPAVVSTSIERAGDQWNFVGSALAQFCMVEHDGPAVFAGRACSKLKFTAPRSQGLEELVMYFDDETRLPVGQATSTSAGSLVSGTARIAEWQTVNGMMIPKVIEVEGQTGSSTLTFMNIQFNAVPASAFETPSDVAGMLAAAGN